MEVATMPATGSSAPAQRGCVLTGPRRAARFAAVAAAGDAAFRGEPRGKDGGRESLSANTLGSFLLVHPGIPGERNSSRVAATAASARISLAVAASRLNTYAIVHPGISPDEPELRCGGVLDDLGSSAYITTYDDSCKKLLRFGLRCNTKTALCRLVVRNIHAANGYLWMKTSDADGDGSDPCLPRKSRVVEPSPIAL